MDPKRLQQVTLNLLTNAMKFSKIDGIIEVGGQIVSQSDGGLTRKYIEIYVKDNGYGISEEDKNKLFKLFGKLN